MTEKTFSDEVLRHIKEYVYSNINLSVPATVTNVSEYSTKQLIDVQPLINYFDEDDEAIEFPIIPSVLVCLEEAGGALISLPVKVGDRVKLDFSKQSLDGYLSSAGNAPLTPEDKRKFALTDCFARLGCPTISTNLKPNPSDVEIKFANSSWKMKANGDMTLDVAGNYNVNVAGNYNINSSTLTNNGINISDTHVHSQGIDSGGDSQVNTDGPQ